MRVVCDRHATAPPVDSLNMQVDRAVLEAELDRLGGALEARLDDVVEAIMRRAREELPREWTVERPELRAPLRNGIRSSVHAEMRSLRAGLRVPDAAPPEDVEFVRRAAQLAAPLWFMLWGYRAGHAAQWEAWMDLVEELADEPAVRRALLEQGSRFFFAYADRLCDFAAQEYAQERERTLRGREQRRVQAVNRLLAGEDADLADLDYDLSAFHVGAIAWGPAAVTALRELAAALDRRLLLVSAAEQTWWGWLGGPRPLEPQARARLRRTRPPAGAALAVGEEAHGRDGFRRTHQQAGFAHRAGIAGRAPVTRYEDVALEALASRDEAHARAFAAAELAGIDGADRRSERLRETLRAYFASGHNAAATATSLGVHEQTVAQRLRAVEERTGRTVATRRAELETALRLRAYLGV